MDIAELARQYLEEIRAVRPHGPYCLAGYCEDAKVAMEVGWQLQAAGEQVGCLLLIDAVWFLHRHRPVVEERFGRARKLARNVQRFGLDFVRHRLDRRRRYAREDLRLKLCELETRVRRLLGAEAPLQLEHRVLITRYYEALGRYRAPAYQGLIHLFVAEEWGLEPDERLPDGVALQTIPGYHDRSWKARDCWNLPCTCAARWTMPTRRRGSAFGQQGFQPRAVERPGGGVTPGLSSIPGSP